MSWWNPFESSHESDTDRGLSYMREFHNVAALNYSASYKLTFNELVNRYGTGFPAMLGNIMVNSGISDGEKADAGLILAKKTKGVVPRDQTEWLDALSVANESVLTNVKQFFSEDVADAAAATYHGVVDGAKEVVGDATDVVLSPLKAAATPLLIIAGVGLLVIFVAGKSGALKIDRVA